MKLGLLFTILIVSCGAKTKQAISADKKEASEDSIPKSDHTIAYNIIVQSLLDSNECIDVANDECKLHDYKLENYLALDTPAKILIIDSFDMETFFNTRRAQTILYQINDRFEIEPFEKTVSIPKWHATYIENSPQLRFGSQVEYSGSQSYEDALSIVDLYSKNSLSDEISNAFSFNNSNGHGTKISEIYSSLFSNQNIVIINSDSNDIFGLDSICLSSEEYQHAMHGFATKIKEIVLRHNISYLSLSGGITYKTTERKIQINCGYTPTHQEVVDKQVSFTELYKVLAEIPNFAFIQAQNGTSENDVADRFDVKNRITVGVIRKPQHTSLPQFSRFTTNLTGYEIADNSRLFQHTLLSTDTFIRMNFEDPLSKLWERGTVVRESSFMLPFFIKYFDENLIAKQGLSFSQAIIASKVIKPKALLLGMDLLPQPWHTLYARP